MSTTTFRKIGFGSLTTESITSPVQYHSHSTASPGILSGHVATNLQENDKIYWKRHSKIKLQVLLCIWFYYCSHLVKAPFMADIVVVAKTHVDHASFNEEVHIDKAKTV